MDSSLVDTTKARVNMPGASGLGQGVRFLDALVKDIVNDPMYTVYLPSRMCIPYGQYIFLGNLGLKNDELLPVVQRLTLDVGMGRFMASLI